MTSSLLVEGAKHSTLAQFAKWTAEADKGLIF